MEDREHAGLGSLSSRPNNEKDEDWNQQEDQRIDGIRKRSSSEPPVCEVHAEKAKQARNPEDL
jgi:hypothetical protein